ncbi:hypothetical protein Y032_0086g1920 [Ancylostoma ceylanicum]|uniref:Uncharacterized protein n=1 Tax=Ancylostoma ceylanicum TaxID=53326 RepID=A0A016TPW2_9BILA|nr:hypothetical protein Y032_0086g1920 [Ancylostoma ceylanicum]
MRALRPSFNSSRQTLLDYWPDCLQTAARSRSGRLRRAALGKRANNDARGSSPPSAGVFAGELGFLNQCHDETVARPPR